MSEESNEMSNHSDNPRTCCAGKGKKKTRVGRAVSIGLLGGALLAVPLAMAGSGYGGNCHSKNSVQSPEELRDRMDRPARWVLGAIDASPEQREALGSIMDASAPELYSLKEDGRALRADFLAGVASGQSDAETLEALRVDSLEIADEASQELVAGAGAFLELLTPEQRQRLVEMARRHR